MELLYHYTSIENLALILKSGQIRFTALDTVDDLNEGLTLDVDDYRQFIFVSCWTNNAEESIPIWNMYAKDMSGVRISLPKYPFNHYSLNDFPEEVVSSKPFHGSTIVNKLHFDVGYIFRQDYHYFYDVIYTNNQNDLRPKLIDLEDNCQTIWSAKIGKYKEMHWQFQSESRYRIIVYPKDGFKVSGDKFTFKNKMNLKYIDIPIRPDAFESMSILLGPKQSEAHKIIVESLIEKYNPKIKLENSSLKIRF